MRFGYSSRSLIQKLGMKPASRVLILNEPDDFRRQLGELPDGVKFLGKSSAQFDFGLAFLTRAAELNSIAAHKPRLAPDGMLWIAWPKKTAKPNSEISEGMVREAALEAGLVDVKVIAIDDYWSGLKLVYRLKDRPPARR